MLSHRIIGILICLISVAAANLATTERDSSCSMTSPCTPLKGNNDFQRPYEVSSSGGVLHTSLVVDVTTVQVDWLTVHRRLYNGTFPGPTLRIKAEDRVHLNLINQLQEPNHKPEEENVFGSPNTTNLHTHGLHISSRVPQDNVFIRVEPDKSFLYQYEIDPEQPAGTYFYHAHHHTSGFFQVSGGMAGMLIVEDDPNRVSEELDLISCPNHCENDVPIVFQDFQYAAIDDGNYAAVQRDIEDHDGFRLNNILINNSTTTLEEWLENSTNNIQYVLVNGVLQPQISIRPGEAKRFRLLNAGGLHTLAVRIEGKDSTNCEVMEIAIDGVYLEKPRPPRFGRSLLLSGGRVDWAVRCSVSGLYKVTSVITSDDERSLGDHPTFTGLLMTIDVTGDAENYSLHDTLPALPSFLRDLRSIPESEIDARFVVEVTGTDSLNREDYIEENIRYRMEVDTIQEWFFTNTEFETSHPIHMHVNSFQIISYNKYTGPYAADDGDTGWAFFAQNNSECTWQHKSYKPDLNIELPTDPLKYLGHDEVHDTVNSIGYAEIGERRDILLVPPLSNITVRFVADKYTGDVVIHCHLLPDADQGMIMTVQIVDKGENTEANITSAGAYPSSCFRNDPIPQPPGGGALALHNQRYFLGCPMYGTMLDDVISGLFNGITLTIRDGVRSRLYIDDQKRSTPDLNRSGPAILDLFTLPWKRYPTPNDEKEVAKLIQN